MTAIATVSGRVIDFMRPDPEQINLDDLQVSLGREPRYSGQTVRDWTVAQHSLLVADLVPREHRLHALLHDAPEAYTRDVASPMKAAMRAIAQLTGHQSPFDVIERDIWKAICRRFDIAHELPAEVHAADELAMVIEAPILQPEGWKHPVWDAYREAELEIGGVHRGCFLNIATLPRGGGPMWMTCVVNELAARGRSA